MKGDNTGSVLEEHVPYQILFHVVLLDSELVHRALCNIRSSEIHKR
jgi:hypothetical protein